MVLARTHAHPWERPAKLGGYVYPGRPSPPEGQVRNVSLSEDEYVAREVEITRAQMDAGLINRTRRNSDTGKTWDDYDARLTRCERYARDRYRGFLAGEVSSL